MASLNNTFELNLKTEVIIALTFLWGAEVFKNSVTLYDKLLKSIWSGIAAKSYIEEIKNKITATSGQPVGYCGAFFKRLKPLVTSPYDYSLEVLQKTRDQLANAPVQLQLKPMQ